MKKIDFEQIKRNLEVKKALAYKKLKEVTNYCAENPQVVVAVIGAIVEVTRVGMKIYGKHETKMRLQEERDLKNLYVYDRTIGTYLKLNRPMRPSEILEFEERKKGGETPALILRSMRLI